MCLFFSDFFCKQQCSGEFFQTYNIKFLEVFCILQTNVTLFKGVMVSLKKSKSEILNRSTYQIADLSDTELNPNPH
jgi:hypothetical protein